ncbi:hypothetical protein GCM10027048_22020 [Hymenobacter coalescens]
MLSYSERQINGIAQDRLSLRAGAAWFASLDEAEQESALMQLWMYIQQAHPSPEEVSQAIETAPVKLTATPLVLLRTHPLPLALRKLVNLPAQERTATFQVMMTLFRLADTRRRLTECRGSCSHEWHHLPQQD